jgi:putative acetyltransferase
MKSFEIRRAKHEDADAIIDSHVRSIREICYRDYTPVEITAWAGRKFKSHLWRQTMDRDFVWVVEVDSTVRGYGHLAKMNDSEGEVMGLYLAPEACGMGAGKKLFKIIEQAARTENLITLNLHATKNAKSFYEKMGFRKVSGDDSISIGGVPIPCIPMSLHLAK